MVKYFLTNGDGASSVLYLNGGNGIFALSLDSEQLSLKCELLELPASILSELAVADSEPNKKKRKESSIQGPSEELDMIGSFLITDNKLYVMKHSKEISCIDIMEKSINTTDKLIKKAHVCAFVKVSGNEVLLIGDKAGEVYLYANPTQNLQAKICITGHTTSMITDMVHFVSMEKKKGEYLITSDRDEKIRISRFPDVHSIESYCLGHKSVISSICLYPNQEEALQLAKNEILFSAGWDHQIMAWAIPSGKLMGRYCPGNDKNEPLALLPNVIENENENEKEEEDGAGEEEGEDDEKEKTYNAAAAGSFPTKLIMIPTPSNTYQMLSTFKTLTQLKVLSLSLEANHVSFGLMQTVELKGCPYDIICFQNRFVFVLLDAPDFIQIFEIEMESSTNSKLIERTDIDLTLVKTTLSNHGVDMAQLQKANENEDVWTKHNLDKPFAKMLAGKRQKSVDAKA